MKGSEDLTMFGHVNYEMMEGHDCNLCIGSFGWYCSTFTEYAIADQS